MCEAACQELVALFIAAHWFPCGHGQGPYLPVRLGFSSCLKLVVTLDVYREKLNFATLSHADVHTVHSKLWTPELFLWVRHLFHKTCLQIAAYFTFCKVSCQILKTVQYHKHSVTLAMVLAGKRGKRSFRNCPFPSSEAKGGHRLHQAESENRF